jgi:hypothetical protein
VEKSAVKSRFGLTLLSRFRPPETKSDPTSATEYPSNVDLLVIWQRMMSSPDKVARAKAGRRLERGLDIELKDLVRA